ncbi:hypothetical protein ES705_30503 [subsurface metagenome]
MKKNIQGWATRKFLLPLKKAIKEGISIERLSVSLALGIIVGLIPLYGVTTVIVGLIAISLRLNFVLMQVAHYIVHPIQIALLIPFLKMGDAVIKTSEVSFSVHQYIHLFKTDFWSTLQELWLVNLSAIGIWLILSIPLFLALYYILVYAIRKYSPKLSYLRV